MDYATAHSKLCSVQLPSQNCFMRLMRCRVLRLRFTAKRFIIQSNVRTGFCASNLAVFHKRYLACDEQLFVIILYCPDHILCTLLPPHAVKSYNLTNKAHNRQLPGCISHLTDCKCCIMMYDSYHYYSLLFYCYFVVQLRSFSW